MTNASIGIHLTDEQLLWHDPFEGDKSGPDGPSFSRVVRTRRKHRCNEDLDRHVIPIGSRAVVYTGRLSRTEWFRFYACADCIEARYFGGAS